MAGDAALIELIRAIGAAERDVVAGRLSEDPDLATIALGPSSTRPSPDEFFLDSCGVQIYAGHTALHVAARAYDLDIAAMLVAAGADVRARNRRGAEPLHAATDGGPGSARWEPTAQVAMITYLIEAGAAVDATATGGVTPLQRAVRNRCSAAVGALLAAGADRGRTNDSGSTAVTLAQWTTGRGGTGSPDAKREHTEIIRLLSAAL